MRMTVCYKNQEFKDVRTIGFDISNELGICAYIVQEVKNEEHPEQNSKCTTLEGIEIRQLKISED